MSGLCLLLVVSEIKAETPSDQEGKSIDQLSEMRQLEAERERLSQREESILRELQQLDRALSQEEQELRDYESQMAANRKRLENLYEEMRKLDEAARDSNQRAIRRIRGIYKLRYHSDLLSPIRLLTTSEGLGEWISRYQYLRAVVRADRHLLEAIRRQYAAKLKLQQKLAEQRRQLHLAGQLARQSYQELLDKRAQRRGWLERLQQDKERYDRAIQELQQRIRQMQGQIEGFAADSPLLRRYGLSPRDRGKLPWPVDGKRVPNLNRASHGVTIQAPVGTPVRAVADGVVRQSDWVLGYGNVLILDHGDAYFSVYAHLSEVLVPPGTRVRKEQVIAKVGETGSLKGPLLYFELWKGKTPLNTLQWLQRKAE